MDDLLQPARIGDGNSTKWEIFLSSVFGELAEFREAVRRQLKAAPDLGQLCEFHFMEEAPGSTHSAEQKCAERVRRSDLLVVLVGEGIGTVIPGWKITYTELEVSVAESEGIPWMWFEVRIDGDGRGPDTPSHAKRGFDARKLDDLMRRLNRRSSPKKPRTGEPERSPDELARSVVDAVRAWLREESKPRIIPVSPDSRVAATRFIDREQAYQKLRKSVMSHAHTVVAGSPGTGKTLLTTALSSDALLAQTHGPIVRASVEERGASSLTVAQAAYSVLYREVHGDDAELAPLGGEAELLAAVENLAESLPTKPVVIFDITQLWWDTAVGRPGAELAAQREPARLVGEGIERIPRSVGVIVEVADPPVQRVLEDELRVHADALVVLEDLEANDGVALLRSMGALCPLDETSGRICDSCEHLGRGLSEHLGKSPLLLAVAGGFLRQFKGARLHEELGKVEDQVRSSVEADREYVTIKNAFEHLSSEEQDLLVVASLLLMKPYPLNPDLLAFLRSGASVSEWMEQHPRVDGRSPSATHSAEGRLLRSLEERRVIEAAPSLLGRGRPDGYAGTLDGGAPLHAIHPKVAFLVQRLAREAGDRYGPSFLASTQARAAEYCDQSLQGDLDDEAYATWYVLELPETQLRILSWLYLTLNSLTATADSQQLLKRITRFYLKAHWWWGFYLPFALCDHIVDVIDRYAQMLHSTRTPAAAREIMEHAASLREFNKSYPKEALFRRPSGNHERLQRWRTVAEKAQELASQLGVEVGLPEARGSESRPFVGLLGYPRDEGAGVLTEGADDDAGDGGQAAADEELAIDSEITQYLHVFLAHALANRNGGAVMGKELVGQIEAHYQLAIDLAVEEKDWWNVLFYQAELGTFLVRAGLGERARELAPDSAPDDYEEREGPDSIDFEVRTIIERVHGDAAVLGGDWRTATDRYLRALYCAASFQEYPEECDPYTGCFLSEHMWRFAGLLLRLFEGTTEPVADRADILSDLCDVLEADAEKLLALLESEHPEADDVATFLFHPLYEVNPEEPAWETAWLQLRDLTEELFELRSRIRLRFPDLKGVPGVDP